MKKNTIVTAASFIIIIAAAGVAPAFASNSQLPGAAKQHRGEFEMKDAFKFDARHMPIFGTVTVINGSNITITAKDGKVYTINASAAKIFKDRMAVGALSDITIGSAIAARGTVTGTTVAATEIMTGIPKMTAQKHEEKKQRMAIGGKVAAISTSSITLTPSAHGMRGHGNKEDRAATPTNFTVTMSAITKIMKDGKPATLADIVAGSEIMVRGTIDTAAHTVAATTIEIKKARIAHSEKSEKDDDNDKGEKNKKRGHMDSIMKKAGKAFNHKK